MTETRAFWLALALFAAALALAGCTSGGTARECAFARPLHLSHHSIAGLDDEDARAVVAFNRQVREVCGQ